MLTSNYEYYTCWMFDICSDDQGGLIGLWKSENVVKIIFDFRLWLSARI